MAWGVPKLGTLATVTSNSLTLTEPTGVDQGDLMVACIAAKDTPAFSNADWTVVATQQSSGNTDATDGIASGVMFYCVRGASAPSLVFTRTAGNVGYGQIVSYHGTSATPYDTGSAATQTVPGNTPTTLGFLTVEDGELLVAMVAMGDQYTASAFDAATDPTTASGATDTTTAPTAGTWIERSDSNTNSGADTGLAIADAIRSTAGLTGLLQVTMSSASGQNALIVGAFKQLGVVASAYSETATTALVGTGGSITSVAVDQDAVAILTGQGSATAAGIATETAIASVSFTGQAISNTFASADLSETTVAILTDQGASTASGACLFG